MQNSEYQHKKLDTAIGKLLKETDAQKLNLYFYDAVCFDSGIAFTSFERRKNELEFVTADNVRGMTVSTVLSNACYQLQQTSLVDHKYVFFSSQDLMSQLEFVCKYSNFDISKAFATTKDWDTNWVYLIRMYQSQYAFTEGNLFPKI